MSTGIGKSLGCISTAAAIVNFHGNDKISTGIDKRSVKIEHYPTERSES